MCVLMCGCVIRELEQSTIVVKWVDNFSKCYAVAMQGAGSGAFKDCNWTGRGMKVYQGPDVDITLLREAMPDDMFEAKTVQAVLASIKGAMRRGWHVYDRSIVKTFRVNNIPLKPIVDPIDHKVLSEVLSESRDGLSKFYPIDIIPQNVGCNRGLLLILKQISDARSAGAAKMEFLCCDCNIFMRIMKVCVFGTVMLHGSCLVDSALSLILIMTRHHPGHMELVTMNDVIL